MTDTLELPIPLTAVAAEQKAVDLARKADKYLKASIVAFKLAEVLEEQEKNAEQDNDNS